VTAATNDTKDDDVIDTIDTIGKLEALAAWHRLNAEHAGSTWVWDARLRTAEDLERRAAELRARQVRGNRSVRRVPGRAAPRETALSGPSL
jgi:hypothetical protein